MPGPAADALAAVTDQHRINAAIVLGSCCPSVLTAIAFGNPDRAIRMVDENCRWGCGDDELHENTDADRRYPAQGNWLPFKCLYSLGEWSWSPRLGDMVFADLPGSSNLVQMDFARVVGRVRPRIVVMGFMSGRQGPDDLEALLISKGWPLKEETFERGDPETCERLHYRLVVGERPDAGDSGEVELASPLP